MQNLTLPPTNGVPSQALGAGAAARWLLLGPGGSRQGRSGQPLPRPQLPLTCLWPTGLSSLLTEVPQVLAERHPQVL